MELIPGGQLYERLLSKKISEKLYDRADELEWSDALSRQTQHYWHEYEYGKKRLGTAPDPPKFLECITDILHAHGLLRSMPNQIIVNKYLPGQGISAHTDDPVLFDDEVATLSLGSGTVMTFVNRDTSEVVDVHLPIGSLFVMNGEARYRWTHEIKKRKSDTVNGVSTKRGTRISVTWRSVK